MSNKNATAAMAGKAGEKDVRARRSTVRRMLGLFSAHPAKLAATFALVVAVVVCTLALPTLSGRAVDCVVGPGEVDFAGLTASLRAIALTIVAIFACQWGLAAVTNRLSFDAACDLRRQAFDHIQEMPLSYIDSHEHGDLTSRIVTDVDQLTNGLVMGFQQLPTGVLTIVVTLVFMFRLNATIALVVTFLTPFSVWAAKFISSHASRHFAGQTRLRGELTGLTEEMIGGISSVEAFGMAEAVSARFDEVDAALGDENFKAVFFSSLANPTMRFANALVYAAVGVFGAFVALSGGITVGGLSAFLSYADQYAKPFNDITGVVTELQNSVACAERVFALVDEPAQLPEAEGALELGEVTGAVTLDHVRFGYAPEHPILTDVDLEVAPGQRIALVGHTGCGKTTLINLILRFYDLKGGSIAVDGVPTTALSRHALRGSFGMVLQETWIKRGTVRENIAFGRPEATDEEIIQAAKAAHSWEFIQRLPQGLDTVLTEESLSQGQRQLLCIARVMLCLPPMLILDEATSSIDTRTEVQIQQAFDTLMEGRTSFVVAHRLSTIRNADLILVMRDGQIVEQGRHEELLAAGGFYAKLYESQFQPA